MMRILRRRQQQHGRERFIFSLLILVSVAIIATEGWAPIKHLGTQRTQQQQQQRHPCVLALSNPDTGGSDADAVVIPSDLAIKIRSIAEQLWDGAGSGSLDAVTIHNGRRGDSTIGCDDDNTVTLRKRQHHQGEMPLPASVPISQRYAYFLQEAKKGDPRAQHSVGLLLWNGFAAATEDIMDAAIDPEASARWHAAAAVQGNIDALAVLGGCLRTGSGVVVGKKGCKDIALGLRCIEYTATSVSVSVAGGSPSGTNKKAAMMEANDDYPGAMRLYKQFYDDKTKRVNALLLFNLGYCLVHGVGIDDRDIDVEGGERLWKDAVDMAPEEGSEEAAWFLYQQHASRDDEEMAGQFLNAAADLGHQDAKIERGDS